MIVCEKFRKEYWGVRAIDAGESLAGGMGYKGRRVLGYRDGVRHFVPFLIFREIGVE